MLSLLLSERDMPLFKFKQDRDTGRAWDKT
jgi:hypothetical protein